MIEFRSDTFTLPTPEMRAAIASAPVGDDCYGEDPTVNRLERLAASVLGKEASCLMPSGTMANLAALLAHCPRGTSVLVGAEADIFVYQAAGAAVCGGLGYVAVPNLPDGTLDQAALEEAFPEDPHDPQFALPGVVCVENTQNRCGGVVLPPGYLPALSAFAADRGVPLHLDGARIFNAAVASGAPVASLVADADSVQFCLSKGLGAPIGSMVAGSAPFVERVRRVRKMLGGGMRQAGLIAAAGIVALTDGVARLGEDHATARRLAAGLGALDGVTVTPPQTNIVLFTVPDERWSVPEFVHAAAAAGISLGGFGHGRLRMVTHSGTTPDDVDQAVDAIARLLK
ncbi:MAG TPA: GntG family PLP-dependent aldolase [Pseudonocardiaceae bacterium]